MNEDKKSQLAIKTSLDFHLSDKQIENCGGIVLTEVIDRNNVGEFAILAKVLRKFDKPITVTVDSDEKVLRKIGSLQKKVPLIISDTKSI